jgi:hypothetical protein
MKKKITLTLCFISTILFSQAPNYVPTNGLSGWWPFTGNANDISGNGNNGTVNGVLLSTDRFGDNNSAFFFDGISNNISLPLQQNGIISYTVSSWFKTSVGGPILSGRGSSSQVGLTLLIKNNGLDGNIGEGKAIFRADGPFIAVGKITNSTYLDNQWHHFVGVYNGAVGTIISSQFSIYIDNILVGQINEETGSSIAPINNGTNLLIGSHQVWQNGGRFNGILDDIGIWNRALTQQEITNLYNASLSIEDFALNTIDIYPNPTTSILNFKSAVQVEKIAIYNILGQLVQQEKVNALEGAINIEKLAQGTYLVKVNDIAKGYSIIKN